jgi:hypothetical protein
VVDLLEQHHREGRRFEPTAFIEEGPHIAVAMTVSDPHWQGEPATDVFKVFTFWEPDGQAVLLQDCSDRDDALAYLAAK